MRSSSTAWCSLTKQDASWVWTGDTHELQRESVLTVSDRSFMGNR
jgi:hypothetical protein